MANGVKRADGDDEVAESLDGGDSFAGGTTWRLVPVDFVSVEDAGDGGRLDSAEEFAVVDAEEAGIRIPLLIRTLRRQNQLGKHLDFVCFLFFGLNPRQIIILKGINRTTCYQIDLEFVHHHLIAESPKNPAQLVS